jgi:DNA mismatch repair ATPase MutS
MRRSLPADIILFYRLGDFYEMFFDDAKAASPIMNVALTKRGGTPMCGVPYHAAQGYIARLLKDHFNVHSLDGFGCAKCPPSKPMLVSRD